MLNMEKQEQKKLRYHTFKARCKKKKNNRNRKVYKKEVQMKKNKCTKHRSSHKRFTVLQNAVHLPFHDFVYWFNDFSFEGNTSTVTLLVNFIMRTSYKCCTHSELAQLKLKVTKNGSIEYVACSPCSLNRLSTEPFLLNTWYSCVSLY